MERKQKEEDERRAAEPFCVPARGALKGDKALVVKWLVEICINFWGEAGIGQRGGG